MKITKTINHDNVSVKALICKGNWVKYRAGRTGAKISAKGIASVVNPIFDKFEELAKSAWNSGKTYGEIVDIIENHFSN